MAPSIEELAAVAAALAAPGKGLLASDESTGAACAARAALLTPARPPAPRRRARAAARASTHSPLRCAPPGTIGKRLEKAGIENTAENRRAYRELFYTAPGIGDAFSGVIMFKARA